jgi:F-type H+-transporting ATPase subunit delta
VPDRRRAWARALFLAAPDRASRSAFADALGALSSAIEGDPRIREFLADPSRDKRAKASLLRSALDAVTGDASGDASGEAKGAAVFERFCSLVVDKGRAALLPQIARSYGAMRDADEGIVRLEVEAAREADPAALERIALAWSAYSGAKSTRTSLRVNPALIAGYRLRAGSLRIDYSVAGRLERLRRELARPLGKPSAQAGAPGAQARGEG